MDLLSFNNLLQFRKRYSFINHQTQVSSHGMKLRWCNIFHRLTRKLHQLFHRNFNRKNSVTSVDDCVHIAIDKGELQAIYNERGGRGVEKMIDDLIECLAPGEEKISTYKEDNPRFAVDRGDHYVITQKVDR